MMLAQDNRGRTPWDVVHGQFDPNELGIMNLLLQRYKNKIAAEQSGYCLHGILSSVSDNHGLYSLPLGRLSAEEMLALLTLFVSDHPNPFTTLDDEGAFPLHIACRYGGMPFEVMEFLVEQDPAILLHRDNYGNLPIHALCSSRQPPNTRRPQNSLLAMMSLFTSDHPSELSTSDGTGALPLHRACRNREMPIDVLCFLVDQGPTALYHRDQQGNLPMHVLCSAQPSLDAVRYLLDRHDASIAAVNRQGRSPMLVAALASASVDVLFYLLRANPTTVYAW